MTSPRTISPLDRTRPWRGTKIVATLGPASDSPELVRELARAGTDVFRLNLSHGTHAQHAQRLRWIRQAEDALERSLGVLMDLQGPKLRIGRLARSRVLEPGTEFELVLGEELAAADDAVPIPHAEIFAALKEGHQFLVDDGKLRFTVLHAGQGHARVRAEVGGILHERKGLNLPDTVLPMPALTPKDVDDLAFGLALDVDWVACSFVQSEHDMMQLRTLVDGRAALIAKIERPSAVERLEAILRVSDAVMVARGDLGVEMPAEQVPELQRRIVEVARERGKPVIVATQMLESMTASPLPTRAETSDVATAVFDGVDAVMLSAESASGRYPVEAVRTMARIIGRVESEPRHRRLIAAASPQVRPNAMDAIGAAARAIADTVRLGALVAYTQSGESALRIAHVRPDVPIVGLTPNPGTARRIALVWGVRPVRSSDARDVDEMVSLAMKALGSLGEEGTRSLPIAVVAGMPFGTPGSTNLLRLVLPGSAESLRWGLQDEVELASAAEG